MARSPTGLACASALALAAALGACSQPSSENIQLWKTTQKGPERLHDALADKGVAPRLRAEAAVALVDMGKAEEVDQVLASMSADEKAEIGKTLVPAYEVAMKDPAPEKALGYRDALYSLRQVASAEDQKRIDAAMLPAIEAALRVDKLRQGRHSVDKMLTTMGPEASAMLAKLCGDAELPYLQTVQLLAKVGDEGTREKCAAALVVRAPKIRTAEKQRPEQLYKALGELGGPSSGKFLQERASGTDKDDALMATRALAVRRDPAVLAFALKVAGDSRADKALRDEMFGVVEAIGGLEAEKGLLGIISSDRDEIVRYRAFESVLAARKTEGILPALEAFPASATYKKVDVDDLMVKLIEKMGQSARPALVKALASRAPLARMTAAMALAEIGRASDVSALEKLAADNAPVKGFPTGDTVGKAATRAAEAARKRS